MSNDAHETVWEAVPSFRRNKPVEFLDWGAQYVATPKS